MCFVMFVLVLILSQKLHAAGLSHLCLPFTLLDTKTVMPSKLEVDVSAAVDVTCESAWFEVDGLSWRRPEVKSPVLEMSNPRAPPPLLGSSAILSEPDIREKYKD